MSRRRQALWTAPGPVLLASATMGLALAVGAPPFAVVAFGLMTYLAYVLHLQLGRLAHRQGTRPRAASSTADRRRPPGGRWLELEREADTAVARYDDAVDACREGPLRDRLRDLRGDVVQARDLVHAHVEVGVEMERQLRRPVPTHRRRDLRRRRDVLLEDVRATDAELGRAAILALELAAESRHRRRGSVDGPVIQLEALQASLRELRAVEG